MAEAEAWNNEDEHLAALRLAAIIDSADDAIIGKTLEGTITSWNAGAQRLYGYKDEEVVGKPITVLVPSDRPDEVPGILARLRRGERIEHFETVRIRKDGKAVDVELTISPIRDADGSIVGASTIARDISERKRMQAALEAARDEAMQASRLKSEFLANMSHEVRTPLNAVIGMSGLLIDSGLSAEQREYAETVRTSGEVLLTVINDILDFSKIEAGKLDLEIVDLGLMSVVHDVTTLIADPARQKGLAITTSIDPAIPGRLLGDPSRLRQILTNLASNAVKFTERGSVTIRVKLADRIEDVAVVRFEVTDTGIGVPPDRRDRLFQAFSQADASTTRTYGGTGLGLAIAKRLTELLGGEIGVETEPGKGSTFWFTLPLEVVEEAARPAEPEVARTDGDRRGRGVRPGTGRILVVEDNPVNQKVALAMLRNLGYAADTVANGREAVEAVARAPYAAVLMDVHMPEMDGYTATREIRKLPEGADLPIVAMTASAMMGDRETALKAGMDDYMTKPVKLPELVSMLQRWIGEDEDAEPGAEQVAGDGSAVLDETTIAHLRLLDERAKERGARDTVGEVVQMFYRDTESVLSRLQAALDAGDAQEVSDAAHHLTGSAATMGAPGMAQLSEVLDRLGRGRNLEGGRELLARLETEFAAVRAALVREFQRG